MHVRTFSALTVAILLASGAARAAEPDAADAAFRRGIALMERGAIPEACAAFEESERLESKAGTLLNLAGCYERASRAPEAYRTFERAREAARARQRADWEAVASEHMAALRSRVTMVAVDASSVSGLHDARVSVDGRVVGDDELRRGLVLGPGTHVIRSEAPGYRSSEQTLATPPDARVKLRPLEQEAPSSPLFAAPAPAPAPAPAREGAPSDPSVRRTVGVVVAATGAAAIAFGAVGGFVASGALSDAKSACPSYPDRCTPEASAPNDRATTWSTLSTVGFVSGAALVAVGVVLYLWPASGAASSTTAAPRASRPVVTLGLAGSGVGLTF